MVIFMDFSKATSKEIIGLSASCPTENNYVRVCTFTTKIRLANIYSGSAVIHRK